MKECTQCGKCCTKYSNGGLSATREEIEMWALFRPDIADYVRNGKIWMDPESGKQIDLCPFLRLSSPEQSPAKQIYTCDIYHDRPDDCRFYPVTIKQMLDDDCEMIEIQDLTDPIKAQRTLDKLMEDSRPPFDKC
ncbi:MAG: Fe-S-cluster containining protein [Paraglaciecola sp.]